MSYDANGNTAGCRTRRFCVCGFRVDSIAAFNRIVCCPRKVLLSNIDKLCQQGYPWHVRTSEVSPMPMNISLTPHLEEMIREKIASGSYNSERGRTRGSSPHGTRGSVAISEAAETTP